MTDTVFPYTDQDITQDDLRAWALGVSGANDYIESGFDVTDAGGLLIDISAGVGYANGVRFERDAATEDYALTANATNYIYAGYTTTNPATVDITSDTDNTPAANEVPIATVVTDASSVTSITTTKRTSAIGAWRDP